MKFMITIFLIGIFSLIAHAENTNDKNTPDNSAINQQAPADSYDGSELDTPADGGKAMRAPSSAELPYTDDEIQNNSPENYKTKNMPIDKD